MIKILRKNNNCSQLLLLFLSIIFVIFPLWVARADITGQTPSDGLQNPLGTKNVADILEKVLGWLVGLSIPIVAVMIVIGAYQIMFSRGSTESVTSGRKTITYAVIGLAIVFLSYSAVALLKYFLGIQ